MEKRKLRLTPRAQSDLQEIWLYGAEEWSPAQADIYLEALSQRFDALCAMPTMAREYNEFTPVVRIYGEWLGKGFTHNHFRKMDRSGFYAYRNHVRYWGLDPSTLVADQTTHIDHEFEVLAQNEDPASIEMVNEEIKTLRRIYHLLKGDRTLGRFAKSE